MFQTVFLEKYEHRHVHIHIHIHRQIHVSLQIHVYLHVRVHMQVRVRVCLCFFFVVWCRVMSCAARCRLLVGWLGAVLAIFLTMNVLDDTPAVFIARKALR